MQGIYNLIQNIKGNFHQIGRYVVFVSFFLLFVLNITKINNNDNVFCKSHGNTLISYLKRERINTILFTIFCTSGLRNFEGVPIIFEDMCRLSKTIAWHRV